MFKRMVGIAACLALIVTGLGPGMAQDERDRPELHPQKFLLEPAVPLEQGELLNLRVDIVNTGRADAGPFTIDYAWRKRDEGEARWSSFDGERLGGLRILDQEVTRTARLDTALLPTVNAPTVFELRVLLDAENQVDELDESNNALVTSFTLRPTRTVGKPDLRPLDLKFVPASPVNFDPETMIAITSTILNTGDAPSAPFDVTFAFCALPLAPGARICPQELTVLETVRLDTGLGRTDPIKGEGVEVSAMLPLQDGSRLLEGGTYQIQVTVDPVAEGSGAGEVEEQDEANNALTGFLTVRGSELHPTGVTFNPPLVRGDQVLDVTASIANTGNSAAGDYKVAFYVNAIRFASVRGPQIDAGNEQTVTARLNPAEFDLSTDRTHRLRVVVDSDNQISEPDESNNTLETSLTLLPAQANRAELHPKDIVLTPPSPVEKGRDQQVIISSSIVNTGSHAALDFDVAYAFRAQGARRWQTLDCITPPGACRGVALGRSQEQRTQGRLTMEQLEPGVTYEVRVLVDPDDRVAELDESNNALVTTLTVRVPARPDLAVEGLRFDPALLSLRRGQQVRVSADLINVGEVPVSSSFEVVCELVDLNAFERTAFDRVTVQGLGVGEARTIECRLDTAELPPGAYQVSVTADPDGRVADEANRANNAARTQGDEQGDGNVLLVQGPDLQVNLAPETSGFRELIRGQPLAPLRFVVENVGEENASAFRVSFPVICSEEQSDFSRPAATRDFTGLVEPVRLPGLGRGERWPVSFELTGQQTALLPAGFCELSVRADSEEVVAEANEFNNALPAPVQLQITPPLTDLVLRGLALEPMQPVRQGDAFELTAELENAGGRAGGPFTLELASCLEETADGVSLRCEGDDRFEQFRAQTVEALDPGATRAVVLSFGTANLTPGRHVFRVRIDPGDRVLESDEDNNVGTVAARVLPQPANLRPRDIHFNPSAPVRQDQPLEIRVTVDNRGAEASGAFTVRFSVCSIDSVNGTSRCRFPQDAEDFRQIAIQSPNNLHPGDSFEVSTGLMPPFSLAPGRYAVLVEVDPEDRVQESDETDNVLVTTPPVEVLPEPPNLRPLEVSFDPASPVEVGQFVLVNARVANFGGQVTGPFLVRFSRCRFEPQPPASRFCSQPGEFTLFAEATVGGVQAGGESTVTVGFDTRGLEPGSYLVRVEVDGEDEVSEQNETDNALVTQPPILLQGEGGGTNGDGTGGTGGNGDAPQSGQSEADLTVRDLALSGQLVIRGQDLNFDFEVCNKGIQTAGGFTVRVFLKQDGDLRREIDSFRVGSMIPDEKRFFRGSLETGNLAPGFYRIIVEVDVFNEVQEAFEANNRQEKRFELR